MPQSLFYDCCLICLFKLENNYSLEFSLSANVSGYVILSEWNLHFKITPDRKENFKHSKTK